VSAAVSEVSQSVGHLSFAVDDDAVLLGFLLLALVLSDAVEEILSTARVLYMLHTHVDPLCQDATPANHTTGCRRNKP